MSDDTTNIPLKRCRMCNEQFPATHEYFQRDKTRKDGLRYRCKECEQIGRRQQQKRVNPVVEIDGILLKRCAHCQQLHLATTEFFGADKAASSGLTSWCKSCRLDYQRTHTFVRSEEQKKRYNESAKKYQRKSNGRRREYQRAYRLSNPDKMREKWRRQALKNPEARKARGARRRSRKRNAPTNFSHNDWMRCLEYWGGCCAVCGRPPGLWHRLALDHWIPLSNPECPGTIPTNIVPLCHSKQGGEGSCNATKSALDGLTWLIWKLGARQGKKKFAEIQAYFKWIADNSTEADNGSTGETTA
jgi:hypothetical protein